MDYPNPLIQTMDSKGELQFHLRWFITGQNSRLIGAYGSAEDALHELVGIKTDLARILIDKTYEEKDISSDRPHITRPISDDWFAETDEGITLEIFVPCHAISTGAMWKIGPFEDREEAMDNLESILTELEQVFLARGIHQVQ